MNSTGKTIMGIIIITMCHKRKHGMITSRYHLLANSNEKGGDIIIVGHR